MVNYQLNMTSTNNTVDHTDNTKTARRQETKTEREISQLDTKSDMHMNAQSVALIKRLTVLYSIAFSGLFFLMFSAIIMFAILAKYGDIQHNISIWCFALYFRIAAQIDAICNSICLLLHNAQTNRIYEKYCICCQTCIFDTNFCRLLCPCIVTLNQVDCCHCCLKWA